MKKLFFSFLVLFLFLFSCSVDYLKSNQNSNSSGNGVIKEERDISEVTKAMLSDVLVDIDPQGIVTFSYLLDGVRVPYEKKYDGDVIAEKDGGSRYHLWLKRGVGLPLIELGYLDGGTLKICGQFEIDGQEHVFHCDALFLKTPNHPSPAPDRTYPVRYPVIIGYYSDAPADKAMSASEVVDLSSYALNQINQYSTGTCYFNSTTGIAEWFYNQHTGHIVDFSEPGLLVSYNNGELGAISDYDMVARIKNVPGMIPDNLIPVMSYYTPSASWSSVISQAGIVFNQIPGSSRVVLPFTLTINKLFWYGRWNNGNTTEADYQAAVNWIVQKRKPVHLQIVVGGYWHAIIMLGYNPNNGDVFIKDSLGQTNLKGTWRPKSWFMSDSYGAVGVDVEGGGTNETVPGVPTGARAINIGTTSFTADWDDMARAASYDVQLWNGSQWVLKGSSTTSSLNITGLPAGSTQYFNVRAANNSGTSDYCDYVTVQLNSTATPTYTPTPTATVTSTAVPVTGITISPGSISLTTGQASTLTAIVSPSNATNKTVYWVSSNTGVATVSSNGIVTAVTAGSTVITVITQDGSKTAACYVTVNSTACNAPTGLTVVYITSNSADLSWNGTSSYYQIYLGSASSGNYFFTSSASITFADLTPNTLYTSRVRSYCDGTWSEFTPIISFTTQDNSLSYCTMKGNTSNFYISNVKIGTINNTSGNDNGYRDFTHLSTNMAAGSVQTITLTSLPVTSSEKWLVWIDYNHDGDFTDNGEEAVSTDLTSNVRSAIFTVPSNAVTGTTRMRVARINAGAHVPCGVFADGETEDYTVNITS